MAMANFNQTHDPQSMIGVDFFDHLPDPILLLIFNNLLDAKSLCRCLLVSKRFASLVPQVDSISLQLEEPQTQKPTQDSLILRTGSKSISKNIFKTFISKYIGKPFQFIGQVFGKKHSNPSVSNDTGIDILNWVEVALKNFSEIQSLKLDLPCHGSDIGSNKSIPLLKWEAGYGKELDRCLILGANSIVDKIDNNKVIKTDENAGLSENNGDNEPLFSDDELKLRIIWIISCLIASTTRHNLLKKLAISCPKLEDAVIYDAGKQGKLSMNKDQIRELRNSIKTSTNNDKNPEFELEIVGESGLQMAYVGNLVMKLWYVKELELPSSGKVMKGATMVMIKPEDKNGGGKEKEKEKENDGLNLKGVFQGDDMFEEAAKELMKKKEKRMYRLEMNSF